MSSPGVRRGERASRACVEGLGTEREYCFRTELEKKGKRRYLQRIAQRLIPENKSLRCCGRSPRSAAASPSAWLHGEGVQVWVGPRRCWFQGLQTCGSVWACPVCAAKISEGRKIDVQTAIDNAIAESMGVSLVTLTIRHGLEDQLPSTIERLSKALRRVKSGRAAVRLRQDFGIVGDVRALEVTYGRNGWHPHTHALTFSRAPLTGARLTRYRRRLFVLWYRACEREGLPLPSYRYGVDVRGARYASDYVAKWGFAAELAKPGAKTGRAGGRTPWELLADAGSGDKRAAWLFREYAECFKGRRQLWWSRGLAERLSLKGQLTDQQLLDLPEDDNPSLMTVIDRDTWTCVLRAGAQEQVLAAAFEGRAALYGLLNRLRCTVPHYRGGFYGVREQWQM